MRGVSFKAAVAWRQAMPSTVSHRVKALERVLAEGEAHERQVDNPLWHHIVHDLDPCALSENVRDFLPTQSCFVDLTLASPKS